MNATAAPSPASNDLSVIAGRRPQPVVTGPRPVVPAPARAHRRRRRWIWAGLAVFVVGAVSLEAWRATHPAMTLRYVTAPVTTGSVTRSVTASGSVNPVTTIQVGTYVSGVIQDLLCDYNTAVRKGQVCARIDPRPYQSVVDQDRANLSTARAQLTKDQTLLDYARLTLNRTVDLRKQGIVSQDALDSATSTFDQADAQIEVDKSVIEQHQAALSAAQINLAYTNILSPVTGTVVARNVTMGQTVAASFQTPTLFLIATDLAKMQVDANVSESDIGGIKAGNAASFTVEAMPTHTFDGQVTQVRQAPQTVQNVVTYDVVISVANPELLLKPGMTATVHIIVDRRDNVIRVPDQALRYTPGGLAASPGGPAATTHGGAGSRQVWVLRDGRPTAVRLTIGLDDDSYAEVLQGDLKAGDEVVTSEQQTTGESTSRLPFFRL
ncbi:MAG: efflux RND transporter periplasmic adaptor subunit [Vicinamibacterales bacterium]